MHKILGWLFKGYARRLKESTDSTLELQMEAFKASIDPVKLIRERLKGVRPNHPDDGSILQNHLASLSDYDRLSFLLKAHEVINNESFKMLITSLIVEEEHDSMMYSENMVAVNFNRATINGFMLVEENLQNLDVMWKEESEKNKVMSEEERLSAL